MDALSRLIELEGEISDRYDAGCLDERESIVVGMGRCPVLVSAPHSTRHFRDGLWRGAEVYTGGLARLVYETLGPSCVFAMYPLSRDPAFYADCEYKRAIAAIVERLGIVLVLDLHGAREDRDFDVCVGTIGEPGDPEGRTLKGRDFVVDSLRRNLGGFKVVWNEEGFSAGGKETVTRYASSLGVPAMQLEINRRLRDPYRYPMETANFIDAFSALLQDLCDSEPD